MSIFWNIVAYLNMHNQTLNMNYYVSIMEKL